MSEMHGSVPLLQDYLEHSARRLPDKVALVCGQKRLTYSEIDRAANALARTLIERGVTRGDRVIVFGDNTVDTVVAFWAVLKANAVVSIVNPLTKADKLGVLPARLPRDGADHRRPSPRASGTGRRRDRHWLKTTMLVAPDDPVLSAEQYDTPPPRQNIDVDLAAIIYTSGSHRRSEGRDAHPPQHAHRGDVDHAPTSRTSRTT